MDQINDTIRKMDEFSAAGDMRSWAADYEATLEDFRGVNPYLGKE